MSPQTAHNLNGSGLLPWSGDVKQTFEQQYAALLNAQGITNTGIAYVGSVVSVYGAVLRCTCDVSAGWRLQPVYSSNRLRYVACGVSCLQHHTQLSVQQC